MLKSSLNSEPLPYTSRLLPPIASILSCVGMLRLVMSAGEATDSKKLRHQVIHPSEGRCFWFWNARSFKSVN